MLPAIGFIVATYTVFRFVEVLSKPDTKGFVAFLAIVAALITGLLCVGLWHLSSSVPAAPSYP